MSVSFTCDFCGKALKAEYGDYEGWDPENGATYRFRCPPLHFAVVMCNNAQFDFSTGNKVEVGGCWLSYRRKENIELFHPQKGDPYWKKIVSDAS